MAVAQDAPRNAASPTASAAQQTEPAAAPAFPGRPRIGLVLAGGGAKGAAHIGVLRVLDEMRVPVDCVIGTSMGALVGATYAAGISPKEIESSVLAIDWGRTVGGQGRRDRMPIERKLANMTYSNSLEIGLNKRQVRMPGGLIGTQQIEQVIRTLVASARATQDFDHLPIPFRAIATDMVAGQVVVLDSGDLSQAMRASMALPGVFAPVTIDGRVLSDGGLMRNLPVDVARNVCADVVIAVWMTSPTPDAAGLSSALSVLSRSLDVMIGANQTAQIESLKPGDVGIEVKMGDIGSADFQAVPEAVELGRRAAEAARDSIGRYSVSEADYLAWEERVGQAGVPTTTVADVRIAGTDRVNPDYVRSQLESVVPGATVSAEDIAADTERVYALGDFERVEYSTSGPPEARVIEIDPIEKSWGPDFFRFDLGLSTYESGDLFAILRVDHERTWINDRGAQWHNALQLGRQSSFSSDFYQPFDVRQQFFVQPIALWRDDIEDIYLDGDRVARYRIRERYVQGDVGMNIGTRAQLRAGLRTGSHEATLDTGVPGLPELDRTDDTTVQLRAVYDTRDAISLPTRGTFLNARYVKSEDWIGGDLDYSLFEGVLEKAFSVRGGDSLSVIFGWGDTLSGDLPITQAIELGGIRTFPGLRPGELRGQGYWSAGMSYSWRLLDFQPLFGQALYAGVRLQGAEMRKRFDGVADEPLYGIAGTIGGRTPIGAFLLSLGWVDDHSWQIQFMLGRPLSEGSMLDQVQ